ncbi:hypothetical protein [Paenibacillus camelliae]|uniref:hypothetical protein n=1 Tax=Paenibacillus camelliae TaxID=512410 RepID=UPI00203B5AA2|nr:hypothetical protein [Paenibacillus camelliae]MCM3632627.1 hypothetical protein [Paenibacillus camelliae]
MTRPNNIKNEILIQGRIIARDINKYNRFVQLFNYVPKIISCILVLIALFQLFIPILSSKLFSIGLLIIASFSLIIDLLSNHSKTFSIAYNQSNELLLALKVLHDRYVYEINTDVDFIISELDRINRSKIAIDKKTIFDRIIDVGSEKAINNDSQYFWLKSD